jgi:hypothetical protein
MIFITHLFFRRRQARQALAFRMPGYPWSTLAGAGLMIAVLITTAFTSEFRMTLFTGVPFLVLLSAVFLLRDPRTTAAVSSAPREEQLVPSAVPWRASAPFALLRKRRADKVREPAPEVNSDEVQL